MDDERPEHDVVERKDPEHSARCKRAEADPAVLALVDEQRRDQEPADDEEEIDAERSPAQRPALSAGRRVVPDDRNDREAAKAVERRKARPRHPAAAYARTGYVGRRAHLA